MRWIWMIAVVAFLAGCGCRESAETGTNAGAPGQAGGPGMTDMMAPKRERAEEVKARYVGLWELSSPGAMGSGLLTLHDDRTATLEWTGNGSTQESGMWGEVDGELVVTFGEDPSRRITLRADGDRLVVNKDVESYGLSLGDSFNRVSA